MNAIGWMVAVSGLSWLLVTALADDTAPELFFGMIGPLVCAAGSWVAYERAYLAAPARLTSVMIGALAVKMVLFGAYVVVMLRMLDVRPVPFVVSFTGYFLALYAMEALFLRRLLMHDLRSPGGERA